MVAKEAALRNHVPPVVARISEGRLLIDLRTVFEHEEQDLIEALLDYQGRERRFGLIREQIETGD